MRQKGKKRKSKYPRLRPGEDQLAILPEEPPPASWLRGTSRCPTLQVAAPATTSLSSATPTASTERTLSECPATPAQGTTRTPSRSTIAHTPAKTQDRTPAESPANPAQSPPAAPAQSPPATPAESPEGTAEGKKAPRRGWRRKKKPKQCSSKTVHFTALPDKYEPLEEGVGERESKEEKKYKRKQKAKKYAKNVGKALQTGCRYLLIGFQGLANAYTVPWGVSSVVVGMAR